MIGEALTFLTSRITCVFSHPGSEPGTGAGRSVCHSVDMPSDTRLASYLVRLEKNGVQLTITVQNIRTRAVSMFESYPELQRALEDGLAATPTAGEEAGR